MIGVKSIAVNMQISDRIVSSPMKRHGLCFCTLGNAVGLFPPAPPEAWSAMLCCSGGQLRRHPDGRLVLPCSFLSNCCDSAFGKCRDSPDACKCQGWVRLVPGFRMGGGHPRAWPVRHLLTPGLAGSSMARRVPGPGSRHSGKGCGLPSCIFSLPW